MSIVHVRHSVSNAFYCCVFQYGVGNAIPFRPQLQVRASGIQDDLQLINYQIVHLRNKRQDTVEVVIA